MLDLDLVIDENDFQLDVVRLLAHVRPHWTENTLKFKDFTDGITNKLVGVYVDERADDIVLVRLHGRNTDLLIDRKMEVANMKRLSAIGCSAPLYAVFGNGICYGFVPGQTLDEKTVRDPTVCRLVAQTFVRFHRLRIAGDANSESTAPPPRPVLFPVLRRYLALVPESTSTEAEAASERDGRSARIAPSRRALGAELDVLEAHLTRLDSPVVFCHNDALLKNIIYDQQRGKVEFIDYEYAGHNYQAFDIGNHFCEFSGMTDANFSRYPDRDFQLKWLRTYLEQWHACADPSPTTTIVDDVMLERLYVQVNKFALASNFLWGLWGLVQSRISLIDFDFLGFAIARFQEYFSKKDRFLALQMPESIS